MLSSDRSADVGDGTPLVPASAGHPSDRQADGVVDHSVRVVNFGGTKEGGKDLLRLMLKRQRHAERKKNKLQNVATAMKVEPEASSNKE